MTRARVLARRRIAVVEHVPTQLVLGLPLGFGLAHVDTPTPEPEHPDIAADPRSARPSVKAAA